MLRKRTSGAWIYCAGMNWQRRARRAVAQAPLPAVSQRLRLAPRAGRLEARDTADWKSALRSLREPPAIGSSLAAEFRRGRRRRTERSRSIPWQRHGCREKQLFFNGNVSPFFCPHLSAASVLQGSFAETLWQKDSAWGSCGDFAPLRIPRDPSTPRRATCAHRGAPLRMTAVFVTQPDIHRMGVA